MPHKEVSTYYEAVYLAAQGCQIDEVTIHPHRDDLEWTMKLSSSNIENLAQMFEDGTAEVNMSRYILAEKHVKQRVKEAKLKWLGCFKTGSEGEVI